MSNTILCVDDEETGLSIRKLLLKAEGYDVLTASSGREGLRLFSSRPVSMVLLDYLMPGMDGEATAREMKRVRPEVPIVVLSAYVDIPATLRTIVDGFVVKGADPAELLNTVERTLAGQAPRVSGQ